MMTYVSNGKGHILSSMIACWVLYIIALGAEVSIPKHLSDVIALHENVHPDDASYIHGHGIVAWAGHNGAEKYICHADCSGLLSAVLRHSYGYTHHELKAWIGGEIRPKARNYFAAIVAERGFARITKVRDLLPGDVLATNYPSGESSKGHVMIVVNRAEERESTIPLVDNTRQWSLEIIDSTTSAHGESDTRQLEGKFRNGIGKGFFRLYTDLSENIIGYSWSLDYGAVYYDETTRPIVAGRLVDR